MANLETIAILFYWYTDGKLIKAVVHHLIYTSAGQYVIGPAQ
jgi:hypothetical protein